jgi:hypothetical protein
MNTLLTSVLLCGIVLPNVSPRDHLTTTPIVIRSYVSQRTYSIQKFNGQTSNMRIQQVYGDIERNRAVRTPIQPYHYPNYPKAFDNYSPFFWVQPVYPYYNHYYYHYYR